MDRPSEIMWVHVVRVVSVFLVVWIHSSAEVFFLGAEFGGFEWWVGNVYDSSARVCVPLLFMVTGFLLLGKSEPLAEFMKKRVQKVVVPLLVWSSFFLLWICFYEVDHPSAASSMTPADLKKIYDAGWVSAVTMLWNPVYFHLWFLYALFGMYLVTPLLRVLVQHAEVKLLWYYLFLSVLAMAILPWAAHFSGLSARIELTMVMGTVGYLILGYLLGRITITQRLFWVMVVVALVSEVVTIAGTYYFTAKNNGVLDTVMWGEWPNIMAMSAAIFIIIRTLSEQSTRLHTGISRTVVKALSVASFGIYLVHVMFIYAFAEGAFGFHLTALTGNPIYFVPLLAVLTYGCSFVVIFVMQRLPFIRHAVP